MDYESFKEQFVEDVKDRLYEQGAEVNVSVHEVNKLNESYEAITVTPEGSNIGVNIGIDKFYDAIENGRSYDEVVDKAVEVINNGISQRPDFDIDSLTDYSKMKETLAMEVVSAEANQEMLATVPHQNMEDMAVVYRFVLNSDDEGRASILVTNQMLETMGVTPEQLHADAMENAPQIRPAEIKGMSEVMAEMMGVEQAEMMGIFPVAPEDEQMYVATVPDKVHGAGVLAYQDFMDKAAERVGGECLGLRWEDIDLENRIISVNHNLVDYQDRDLRKQVRGIQSTKTRAGVRIIPMIDEVYEAFITEFELQSAIGFCEEEIDGYSGFIFTTTDQKLMSRSAVNNALHRIVKLHNEEEEKKAKAEKREPILLPQFSAHQLRHTFCTRFCENETNLKVIQSIMGHSDITTTMDIYADATQEKKQEIMANLNGKIF